MPLKDIHLHSCFVETAPKLAEALQSKTYVLSADSTCTISLEERVYSYGAIYGKEDSINIGNCVKYNVEGQVLNCYFYASSNQVLLLNVMNILYRKKLES